MNQLYFGDCLDVLKELHSKHPEGFIDLVYIDPPFNSKRNYNILFEDVDLSDTKAQREAFADTWSNVSYHDTLNEIQDLDLDLFKFLKALDDIRLSKSAISYLTTMSIRLYYIHKVLKNTGSFYLHCDPTMSHYLKIVCDLIFGIGNFRNEIVWFYGGGNSPGKDFSNKHDTILRYSRTNNYVYNLNAISRKNPEFKRYKYEDETGFYRWHLESKKDYKIYLKAMNERDVWEIGYLKGNQKERLGYPTQKPLALLERIIKASSNEGDLVADFFCGCGTTIAAAEKLNRQWLGADISHLAIKLILKRLTDPYALEKQKEILSQIDVSGFPRDIASAKELARQTDKHRIKFQDWIIEVMIGGISNSKKSGDGGYDGYLTFHKSHDGKSKGIGIIEVKSGNVGVSTIRSFHDVVKMKKADIGIFVCFEEQVTKGMRIEANAQGKMEGWSHIDKIQILTVEDLLNHKSHQLPGQGTMKHLDESSQKLKEYKEEGMF